MISLADAYEYLRKLPRLEGSEWVAMEDALGRVLRKTLRAPEARPAFDQSAMDGFAVRRADLQTASKECPVVLRCVDQRFAGSADQRCIATGETMQIATGAMLPAGADAVVRRERARQEGDRVYFEQSVANAADLRRRGEEIEIGDIVLNAGLKIDPPALALLAALGIDQVEVLRRPVIRILSSGDELQASASIASIRDSNTPFLRAFCRVRGIDAQCEAPLCDDEEETVHRIEQAINGVDLLVTTGGASVGDRDWIVRVLHRLGAQFLFQGVAIRPGKPVGLAKLGATHILMLPGNPGAVAVAAELFLGPLLSHFESLPEADITSMTRRARMTFDLDRKSSWTHIVPAKLQSRGAELQVSGIDKTFNASHVRGAAQHQGWLVLPPEEPVVSGMTLPIFPYRDAVPSTGPFSLAFVGASGSGKTTLISKILECMGSRWEILVAKQSHHALDPEPPQKDTARLAKAGATSTLLVTEFELCWRGRSKTWTRMDIESILAQTVPCPDLLLFEGFRRDAGRKILVLGPRCDVHDPRFAAVRSNAVAVVYRDRDAPGLGVPEFEAKRLPELCAWIERNAGLKR